MRVLLSAFACEPAGGSEEGKAFAWASVLAEEHDVVLLVDRSFRPALEPALAARPDDRLRAVYLGSGPRGYEGLAIYPYYSTWQRLALAAARELHARQPFDVVHHISYGMHRVPSYLHELPVPFIWGPVGGAEDVPVRFYAPRWHGLRGSALELVRSAWNLGVRVDPRVRACARGATVPVATTAATRDAFPSEVRSRTVVMRNSVVTAEDRRLLAGCRARTGPRSGLRCMFAGRLLGWKGPLLALEAFAAYARAHPTATFDLYGDGPLLPTLTRRAARLGVADRVHLHGRVPRSEVLAAYGDHHVFLFPSMHDSGGTVAGEALAAGLPVVCLDAGGVGDYVPADAGASVPPTTPRAAIARMVAALTDLTADPARWRRAADAAFAYASDPVNDPPIEARMRVLYGRAGVLRS